ncbi:hypothetical protein MMC25_003325 [Agyrium rufum]|nr:hypothetical protein [Agyrium rufum]
MAVNVFSMPSASTPMSAFSPYTDSPSSPTPYYNPTQRLSDSSSHLLPPGQRNSTEQSDISDPSPIATSSNGTDTTDIEDTTEEVEHENTGSLRPTSGAEPKLTVRISNGTPRPTTRPGSADEEEPSSVIHAPKGFEAFHARRSPPQMRRATPTPSQRSDITIKSPGEEHDEQYQEEVGRPLSIFVVDRTDDLKGSRRSPLSPAPILTTVAPSRDWSATPRAQTRQEAEDLENERQSRLRSNGLEGIPEIQTTQYDAEDDQFLDMTSFETPIGKIEDNNDEVVALKETLNEIWTLCNRLAGLSQFHRTRIFSQTSTGDKHGVAWKSCWRLCQQLYDGRDKNFATDVRPTLDLCRDFCQSLFLVRQRSNDATDSVLRVSFELNTHLYNTHDRALPEEYRERTLEFYITMCHRLMKQRTRLGEETDALLRACWYLAEMLFLLRQNERERKPPTEELLGSAVQACWELCDLFREGWTQIRPERGTPRPSQPTFMQAFQHARQSDIQSTTMSMAESDIEDDEFGRMNPETPTTVFEDTQQMSPDDDHAPNIMVVGTDSHPSRFRNHRWTSDSASSLASYSQASEITSSSTSTIINYPPTSDKDPGLTCLKLLIVKAAIDNGFQRNNPHHLKLGEFVKLLPSHAFGRQDWQIRLLYEYRQLVTSTPIFRYVGQESHRASAVEVACAVRLLGGSNSRYLWLNDLYRLVFGFRSAEAEGRGKVMIQS